MGTRVLEYLDFIGTRDFKHLGIGTFKTLETLQRTSITTMVLINNMVDNTSPMPLLILVGWFFQVSFTAIIWW